jgi:hypothetical protein
MAGRYAVLASLELRTLGLIEPKGGSGVTRPLGFG